MSLISLSLSHTHTHTRARAHTHTLLFNYVFPLKRDFTFLKFWIYLKRHFRSVMKNLKLYFLLQSMHLPRYTYIWYIVGTTTVIYMIAAEESCYSLLAKSQTHLVYFFPNCLVSFSYFILSSNQILLYSSGRILLHGG